MKDEKNELDLSLFTLESILDPQPDITIDDDNDEPPVVDPKPNIDEPEPEPTPEPVSTDEPVKSTDTSPESTEDESDLTPFYEALNKELGIDEFDPKAVEEGIPGLMTYLKDIVNNTVDSEVEEIKSLGDGLLGDLYEFLKSGGKVEDFKKVYFDSVDFKTLNIEDNESNQKLVVEEYLKSLGYDKEEIDEKLESYTETNLLEKEAKSAVKKLEKLQDKTRTELIQKQQAYDEQRKTQIKEYWEDVVNTIDKSDTLGTLPIPKNKRNEFKQFLTQKGKDGLTDYERKIRNKEESLKLALVSFLEYDFTSIKKEVKSELTKDLKKSISRFTDTNAKSKTAVEVDVDTSNKTDYKKFLLPL